MECQDIAIEKIYLSICGGRARIEIAISVSFPRDLFFVVR